MLVNRKFDVTAVAVIVLCIAAYAAFQPRLHLRTDMPPQFFDPSSVTGSKKGEERKRAEAYWKCAVTEIQWKYGYAHRLPDDPPAEFARAEVPPVLVENEEAARIRYWQRLRQVWVLPSAWKQDYGLDLSSMKRSFQSAGDWLEDRIWRLTGTR